MPTDDDDTVIFRPARAPRPEGEEDYSGPDGSRSAMLLRVGEKVTEPSGFSDGDWTYRIWTFAIDDGSEYDGQIIESRTSWSKKASTRSNQYKIMSALAGGDLATHAEAKVSELVNRSCYIAIKTNDKDYPYIDSWMAIPQTRKVPAAKRQPVAAPPDDEAPFPTQAPF